MSIIITDADYREAFAHWRQRPTSRIADAVLEHLVDVDGAGVDPADLEYNNPEYSPQFRCTVAAVVIRDLLVHRDCGRIAYGRQVAWLNGYIDQHGIVREGSGL